MFNRFIVSIALTGMLGSCAPPEDASEESLETRISALDEIAALAVATGMPGVAIALVESDGSIVAGAAGLADRSTGEAYSPAARFHSGSTTKAITATATLILVDRGELRLDARLPEVLPAELIDGIPHADQISVLLLLEHTSGLYSPNNDPRYIARYAGAERTVLPFWTPQEIVAFAADPANQPANMPGEGQQYSDINYVLLSLIVEESAGESFKTFVQREVFDRLEMSDTYFLSDRPDVPRARGYTMDSDIVRSIGLDPALKSDEEGYIDTTDAQEQSDGAAGIITTVADLGRFAFAASQTNLLSSESRSLFLGAADRIGNVGEDESLGVLRGYSFEYGRVVTSEGDGPGTNVVWALDLDTHRIVVAAVNLFGRWDENDYLLTELIPTVLAIGR